jgi:hypothetical protein
VVADKENSERAAMRKVVDEFVMGDVWDADQFIVSAVSDAVKEVPETRAGKVIRDAWQGRGIFVSNDAYVQAPEAPLSKLPLDTDYLSKRLYNQMWSPRTYRQKVQRIIELGVNPSTGKPLAAEERKEFDQLKKSLDDVWLEEFVVTGTTKAIRPAVIKQTRRILGYEED